MGVRNPDSRYLVVRALVRLLFGAGQPDRADGSRDLEILVLRHQLRVLQRTWGPLKLSAIDWVLVAATSRVILPDSWVAFLVTPATLTDGRQDLGLGPTRQERVLDLKIAHGVDGVGAASIVVARATCERLPVGGRIERDVRGPIDSQANHPAR